MNKLNFIVTTTINPPTEAIIKFSQMPDWQLIVVGDLKTPHDDYASIDCIYLHPNKQEEICPDLSDFIGWNCIQRRNIGFIYASWLDARVVASVDDDNIPEDNWGKNYIGQEVKCDYYTSDNPVFDPLAPFHVPFWHRGFPLELVSQRQNIHYAGTKTIHPLIQQGLWFGHPDIDAVARITLNNPTIHYQNANFSPYTSNVISPFNSQNTFIDGSVLQDYACIPHIGRFDDILGGYLFQLKHPNSVCYSKPSVTQKRNNHNFIKDLSQEMWGYDNIYNMITGNYCLPDCVTEFYDLYRSYFDA